VLSYVIHATEKQSLANCGMQVASYVFREPSAQQAFGVRAQVLNKHVACVPSAEPVVKLDEHVHGGAEALDIGHPDAHAAEGFATGRRRRSDKPFERHLAPCAWIDRALLRLSRVFEVGSP
jgi:hypothetical protein